MTRIGDYEIERAVEGGFEATHVVLPRRVRLVVAPTAAAASRKVAAVRMMREACILEALQHPAVPRVYEVGVLADGCTQRPWVASELVTGETLADILLAGDLLAVDAVIDTLAAVADILAHAHSSRIVHGGIRPDSIVRRAPVCVVNWGDARVVDDPDEATRACADDIFALGLVADLLLCGRAAIPQALQALVDEMLAPNPGGRPDAALIMSRLDAIRDTLDAHMEQAIECLPLDTPPLDGAYTETSDTVDSIEDLSAHAHELVDDAMEPLRVVGSGPVVRRPAGVARAWWADAASQEDWRDDDWAAGTGTRSQRRKTSPPATLPAPMRTPGLVVGSVRQRWTPAAGIDNTVLARASARAESSDDDI